MIKVEEAFYKIFYLLTDNNFLPEKLKVTELYRTKHTKAWPFSIPFIFI